MQCPNCRTDNIATNAFCEACGASLISPCKFCGHVNRANGRFCGKCGSPISQSPNASEPFLQLLQSLSATGGERKRLTVLFADIRNSTGLIEKLDPEQAMHRMQPILDAMKDAVHRYDGVVNKVQGDGVMALFGAPRPHEDHAVRGCLAALAMQHSVEDLGVPDFRIRVGLHTGEVVVQAIANSLYQTYDATGAAVHLASRMEQMAESGSVQITADTFDAAKQFIEAKSLGMRMVRGLTTSLEVFELLGFKHAPASERFRSGPRPTPLSGRTRELNALELELTSTVQNETRVVGIVGEAGLGKSRLCFEFAESCRRRGVRVLEARVLAHASATPFQPVLDLLRDTFGIQPTDAPDFSRHRIIPVLLDFLGVGDPGYPIQKLDPKTRKLKLLDFVRQLVHSRPHDEVLLVLIEDLHWIDPGSEEFVGALVDAVIGTKTLLLLNFRPGYTANWMRHSHYRQIDLTPLQNAEAEQLLRDLLGDDSSLALLSRNITERAQGNPFFLEELVSSLAERGDFDGERGAYRLKTGIDIVPIPATVQAVLSARIDRLPESARQMLHCAAVIGREVPLAIAEQVAKLPLHEVARTLAQLRRAELLYQVPLNKEGLHAFRHPLIQEVAYRSLLIERRRELHGDVARAIETQFKDRLDEYGGLMAHHLEQAGESLGAAQAHARFAIWVGAKDATQALRSWMKVRELLIAEPLSQSNDNLKMMACGQIMNFGWREGISVEKAKIYFEEARQLALALNNVRANALIHAGFGRILAAGGSADEYVTKILEAISLAGQTDDASLQATLKAGLCHALRLSGRISDALVVNIEATDRAHEVSKLHRQMLGFEIEPWLDTLRGQLLVMLGRGKEARAYLDRVIKMDTDEINVFDHVMPSISYVDLAWAERDIRLAERHAERAFSMAVSSGNPYVRVYAQACRGLSHIVAGRAKAAVDDLNNAIEFARRRKAGLEYEPRMLADLANAYRLKGDFSAGLRSATEAIDISGLRHTRVSECLARIVRAQITLAMEADKDIEAVKGELSRIETLLRDTSAVIYESLFRDLKSCLERDETVGPTDLSSADHTRLAG